MTKDETTKKQVGECSVQGRRYGFTTISLELMADLLRLPRSMSITRIHMEDRLGRDLDSVVLHLEGEPIPETPEGAKRPWLEIRYKRSGGVPAFDEVLIRPSEYPLPSVET